MSFRIKTHSDQPNPPAVPVSQNPSQPEMKAQVTFPTLPALPKPQTFKYNEVPVEQLLPAQERKDYVDNLRAPTQGTEIEKDVIVYDPFKEQWILVKESEAYKYKTT